MTSIIQDTVNALNLGSLYALYALGIAMVFGILRLINFAHYSLILAGGYTMVETGSLPLRCASSSQLPFACSLPPGSIWWPSGGRGTQARQRFSSRRSP